MTITAFPEDISKPGLLPIYSSRSFVSNGAFSLLDVLAEFHARGFSRYVARNGLTYCNFFTREVMRALGAHLPDGKKANEIFDWLTTPDARAEGWQPAGAEVAQAQADKGVPCVAVWKNPQGNGHITPLSVSMSQPGVWVSHVGSSMYLRCPLAYAFGAAKPLFYVHS